MLVYMSLATLLIAALTGVYTERVANAEMNLSPDNTVIENNNSTFTSRRFFLKINESPTALY